MLAYHAASAALSMLWQRNNGIKISSSVAAASASGVNRHDIVK